MLLDCCMRQERNEQASQKHILMPEPIEEIILIVTLLPE